MCRKLGQCMEPVIDDKMGRVGFALLCWSATLIFFTGLGVFITHSWLLGLSIGLFALSAVIQPFMVSVPEITGLLAINVLKNGMEALVPYGTGLYFRYPWEQVKQGNYINLRQITETITETYPSKDSLMQVEWIFQYTPTLEGLPCYISADDNTIKTGLRGTGSSVLSAEIAKETGDNCKVKQGEIEEALLRKFKESSPTPLVLYGIRVDRVALADVDFDTSVQQARSSQEVSRRIQQTAKEIKTAHPNIDDKDALNASMIIHQQTKKTIFEIEGLGPAIASIVKAFRGGKS